jgi:transposase InsO family protein
MGCRKSIACNTLGLSLRTIERWEKYPYVPDRRQGPKSGPPNKLSEQERKRILEVVNKKEYGSLSPCQIVPKLADQGEYIGSESTIYRLLKENTMLCHRGNTKQRVPYRKPASCSAIQPNEVWSWDITFLTTAIRGQFYYLYIFMDIFSRKIVGYRVYENQTAENASILAKEAYANEKINGKKIKLHSDNGSPMKGSTMLVTLQKLGVIPSFSRPSVSNDNPFSEALFRTLKYCPEYPSKPFESIAHANQWVARFVRWYNTQHLHSGIKFLTPESRHMGNDSKIIEKRQRVYEMARLKNPIRWTGKIRNWVPETEVLLNPTVLDARAA